MAIKKLMEVYRHVLNLRKHFMIKWSTNLIINGPESDVTINTLFQVAQKISMVLQCAESAQHFTAQVMEKKLIVSQRNLTKFVRIKFELENVGEFT